MEFDDVASLYNHISIPMMSMFGVFVILLVTLPFAAVVGYFTGSVWRTKVLAARKKVDKVTGETTLTAILALLGLLLAFSFGNALNLSQVRKSTLAEEAATLGTVFLRADYLAEPGRTKLQSSILEYARTRVMPGNGQVITLADARSFIESTLQAQAKLWPLMLESTADPTPVPIKIFVAEAMNDTLDAHLYRVVTLSTPVSDVTLSMMWAAALIGLFLLGNRAGMVGRKLTWRTFVFSGFLFVVMITIVDTQRGNEGLIRTDDTTLRVTIYDMEQALAGRI